MKGKEQPPKPSPDIENPPVAEEDKETPSITSRLFKNKVFRAFILSLNLLNIFNFAIKTNAEKFPKSVRDSVWALEVAKNHMLMRDSFKTEAGEIIISDGAGGIEIVKAEEVSRILEETFPKGWTQGELGRVGTDYGEEEISRKRMVEWGEIVADFRPITGQIRFFPAAQRSMEEVLEVDLAHEIGHANDWTSDNEMSLSERAELLSAVRERLESEDRYRSAYVEAIDIKDPEGQFIKKASEYWAEIVSQYFQDPTKLNVKDFRLVDERVRATDPGFDAQQAAARRGDIIAAHRILAAL